MTGHCQSNFFLCLGVVFVCSFSLVVFPVYIETFYIFHGVLLSSRCFYVTPLVSSFPGGLLREWIV